MLDRSIEAVTDVLATTPHVMFSIKGPEEGLRLLTTTDVALADVANACGYYDQSAFSRHFRRVVGSTPAAYRAEHQLSRER